MHKLSIYKKLPGQNNHKMQRQLRRFQHFKMRQGYNFCDVYVSKNTHTATHS